MTTTVKYKITAVDKTKKAVDSATKNFQGLGKSFKSLGLVALATAAAIKIGRIADEVDRLSKNAQKLGLAVSELQALNFAASQSGVSVEQLSVAVSQFQKNVSEASQGTGEAVRAFDQLNLSAKELKSLGTNRAFQIVAARLALVADASDRTALSMRIMGESGKDLIPLFLSGASGLAAFNEEFNTLTNGGLSQEQVDAVVALNDEWGRFIIVMKTATQEIIASLGPSLELLLKVSRLLILLPIRRFGEAVQTVVGYVVKLWNAWDRFTDILLGLDINGQSVKSFRAELMEKEQRQLNDLIESTKEYNSIMKRISELTKSDDPFDKLIASLKTNRDFSQEIAENIRAKEKITPKAFRSKAIEDYRKTLISEADSRPHPNVPRKDILKLIDEKIEKLKREAFFDNYMVPDLVATNNEEINKLNEALEVLQVQFNNIVEETEALLSKRESIIREISVANLSPLQIPEFDFKKLIEKENSVREKEKQEKIDRFKFGLVEGKEVAKVKPVTTEFGLDSSTKALIESINILYEGVDEFILSFSTGIGDAFRNMREQNLWDGLTKDFGKLLERAGLNALAVMAERGVTKLGEKLAEAFLKMGLSNIPIIGPLLAAMVPAKALGGPVMSGSPYLVGERGPELFTPGANGNITPNNKLGGNTYNTQMNFSSVLPPSQEDLRRANETLTQVNIAGSRFALGA